MLNPSSQIDRGKTMDYVLDKLKDVKVLPQVVYRVLEATEKAGSSPIEIERQVALDPGFTAKILQIANSAAYALPKKLTSIKDAVMLLGMKEIREVALKASVFDFFVGKTDKESTRRKMWWRSSVDTATVCRVLADRYPDLDSNEAYTAGLLHMIGRALLDLSNTQMYERVLYVVDKGAPQRLAERTVFGIDHIEVAQELCERWKFPASLVQSLNYEDEPGALEEWARKRALVAVAHMIVEHSTGVKSDSTISIAERQWAFDALQINQQTAEGWVTATKEMFSSRQSAA